MQTTIKTVLNRKGRDVWSVAPSVLVHAAVQMMVDKRIEALLVLVDDRLVGILTERDCARRVSLAGRNPHMVAVSEVMTSPVVFVTEQHTVEDCMRILSEHGFAHLPVLEGDRVVGVVSASDLIKSLLHDRDHTITHLEGYITGRYPG